MNISKIFIRHGRCHQKRNMDSQRGVAMVEFALVLPLLLVILFGIIEFGLVLYNQQVITNASREGARYGIVAADPRMLDTGDDSIESVVMSYCDDNLLKTFGSQKIPTVNISGYSSSASYGDDLTVTVSFNYQFLVLPPLLALLSKFSEDFKDWSPLTLKASTVMRYE